MKLYITFIIALFFAVSANAYHDITVNSKTGTAITIGTANLAPCDDVKSPTYTSSSWVNQKVTNTVFLEIDQNNAAYIGAPYHVKFTIELKGLDVNNVPIGTSIINLDIQYDPFSGNKYKDKHVYEFTGYHKIEIKVIGITDVFTGSPVITPYANLTIGARIDVERYGLLNTAAIVGGIGSSPSDVDANLIQDHLTIGWTPMLGAEEYDLEWMFINDYGNSATGIPYISTSTLNYNFKNNSTRVRVSASSFKISLIFNHGYIVYRVRAVGRSLTATDKLVFTDWSISESDYISNISASNYYWNQSSHEVLKSWQYSATYAEEGKYKEIVNYFDGANKSRQIVTKTKNGGVENAIVGESIYDYQGRPTVQVLPTPTLSAAVIKYYENFNLDDTLKPYSRNDFDHDLNDCAADLNGMSNTAGSSKYYSNNNTNQTLNNAFIPNALNYPFTQVEYTPDNTGRIRKQSGVGVDHKIGSGHETQYFYGQPLQKQLDRLFGSEAGYNRHYKKNLVVDANGQTSVSYLDNAGRVVATSLSGAAPSSLNAIASEASAEYTVTEDLFAKDANGVSQTNYINQEFDAIVFNTEVLVPTPGNYDFDYSVTAPQLTEYCAANSLTLCFDCIYDLEIVIKDPCGQILTPSSSPISVKIGAVDGLGKIIFDETCTTPYSFSTSPSPLTIPFNEVGSYTVSKILRINKESFDAYWDLYLQNNTACIKDFEFFQTQERDKIDINDCNVSCEECAESLGTKDSYILAGRGTEADWQIEYDNCMAPCSEYNMCEVAYASLLSDVSPGGQYAQYFDPTDETFSVGNFPLSLFNIGNKLPLGGAVANWKNPSILVSGSWQAYYTNSDGTRSKIRLYKDVNNNLVPSSSLSYTDAEGTYTYPELLTDVEDFIKNWQPSWAKSLVKYHPEYCYYEWCIANDDKNNSLLISSNTFDGRLGNTTTYAQANTNGYLSDPLTNSDPYFISGGVGNSQKAEMDNLIANYSNGLSMKEVASYWAKCPGRMYGAIVDIYSACIDFNDASASTEKKDAEWEIYKNLYLSAKQRMQNTKRTDYVLSSSGCRKYNGCIGTENFNPYASAMVNYMGVSYDAFHDALQPCAAETYALYKTKVRRFFYDETVPELDEDETNYNIFMETGQCIIAIEVENMMDNMAKNGLIGSSQHIANHKTSNYNIYKALLGEPLPTTWQQVQCQTFIISPDYLRVALYEPVHGYSACHMIHFYIPNGSSFTWSQIRGFRHLKVINEVSGTYNFEIKVWVDDDSDPLTPNVEKYLTGNTCFPIGGCTFKNKCEINETVAELQVLMSELAKGGDLSSTSLVGLEGSILAYETFVTDNIRRLVSAHDFQSLNWKYDNVNDKFIIEQSVTTTTKTVDIKRYDPLSFTSSYSVSDIKYFLNSRVNPSSPKEFFIDGYYDDDANPTTPDVVVTLAITINGGGVDVGTCGLPTPLACKTIEHKNKDDLEQLLTDIVTPGLAYIEDDLRSYSSFTSRLKSYLGEGNFIIGLDTTPLPFIEDSGKTMRLPIINSSSYDTVCEIILTLDDSSLYDFNDLTALDNLNVLGLEMTNGRAYDFTMSATFTGGSETITGVSSCFPIRQCDPCFNKSFDCDISYIEYRNSIDNYDSIYAAKNPANPYYITPVTMEYFYDHKEEFCNDFEYYIYYIDTYNPSESGLPPLSIVGYTRNVDLPAVPPVDPSYYCEAEINTLNYGIGAHNVRLSALIDAPPEESSNYVPTVSDPIWFMTLKMCDCIDDYIAYLQGFTDSELLANNNDVLTPAEYSEEFPCERNLPKCFPSGPSDPFISATAAWVSPCAAEMQAIADVNALSLYNQYKDSLRSEFRKRYYETCLGAFENFEMTYKDKEYHYTLYYYDQAGSLVRTVPPAGVSLITSSNDFTKINYDRTNKTRTFFTSHTLATTYEFNSLNQLVRQSVPDNEKMNIWEISNANGFPAGFDAISSHFVSRSKGYVSGKVGSDAYIYKTEDGGLTWQRVTDIESSTLNKIFMTTGYTGYAVGEDGMLYKTIDNGVRWKILSGLFGANVKLNDLYFKDNMNGVVVGDGGFIRKTSDGGSTWSTVSSSPTITADITSISFVDTDTDKGYLTINAAGTGGMYKTTDFGSNWSATIDIRSDNLGKIQMVDASKGYISDVLGLLKTTDGGLNWKHLATNLTVGLIDFYFKDENNAIAVSTSGKLYRTTDGGITWVLASASGAYRALYLNNSYTYGLAVGDAGLVSRIKLSDLSVIKGSTGNTSDYVAGGYVFDNNTAFICGGLGMLYKTTNLTDNTPHWALITTPTIGSGTEFFTKILVYDASPTTPKFAVLTDLGEVHAVVGATSTIISSGIDYMVDIVDDGTNLYALDGNGGGTIKSTAISSLSTMSVSSTLTASFLGTITKMCVQGANQFAIGSRGDIFKVVSSVVNDRSKYTVPLKLNHVEAQTGVAYAVGDNGSVFKYSTSTSIWTKLYNGAKQDLLSVDFWDANNGVFVGKYGVTMRTTNGGSSISSPISAGVDLNDVRFVSSTDAYAAAKNGKIYKTTNAGASWSLQSVPLGKTGTELNGIHSISTTNIIACGTNGRMLSYNGTSWAWLGDFVTNEIKSLHVNQGVGYAGGVSGLLLTSVNSGATWKVKPPLVYPVEQYNAVWAVTATQGIIAGTGGKVRYTANGGSTWSLAYTGASTINGIHFTHKDTGYIVGNSGLMAKTSSGGTSWLNLTSSSATTKNLNAVFGQNGHIIAVGDDGTIVTSHNSVLTSCTLATSGTTEHLYDVYMHDYYTAYAVGYNGTIQKTIDGGTLWANKPSSTSYQINTVYFGGRYFGFFGGEFQLARNIKDEADIFSSYFWYDKLGRISVSQNTKQFNKTDRAYSYTRFDALGRITEVGENATTTNISTIFVSNQMDDALLSSWIVSSSSRTEVTRTFYDAVVVSGLPITQTNLRKRVVTATYSDVYDSDPKVYDHATHYSYDVHGMVNTLLQDNPSLASLSQQYKTVEYEYDLVTGITNTVYYQRGEADQYTYYYEYDADNKIIKAFTSRCNGIFKDQDSRYLYYDHGSLARTEIGDLQVQGIDYAYTILGWQKGVNSDMVDPTKDMGRDGDYTLGSNVNLNFARDVFGYSLGYFEGDYYSINNVSAGGNHFLASLSGSDLLAARNDLYNGNISHMVTSITQPGTTTVLPYGYAYQYDQLNRLLHMEGYNNLDFPSNSWKTGGYTGAYETSLTYDANGNILTLNRNGEAGNINMDNLSYQYDWVNNDPAQGLRSNKLYHVNDAITSTYTSDIDDQGSFTPASSVDDINALNNYGYDELGNPIRDEAEGIASIEWTVYGKIKSITRSASSTASNLSFKYDAQGKRIEKRETPYGGGADKVTYYVYDASGNLMATYSRHLRDDANDKYDGEEMFVCNSHIIYGSSRIGVDARQDTLVGSLIDPIPTGYHTRLLGSKQYENSNHLGNVLVTISDIKIPHDYNANSVVDYYTADIISAQDYYPFGSIMPGRNWSNEEYRFGFNGKERDDEIDGAGNSLNFGARIYDSRLGRWMGLDPLYYFDHSKSPYSNSFNNPIIFKDEDGKWPIPVITGLIGGVGNALYGVIKGEDIGSVAKRFVSGAVAGFLIGLAPAAVVSVVNGTAIGSATVASYATIVGPSGTVMTSLVGGVFGSGIENLIDQGIDVLTGAKDEIDPHQISLNMATGMVEGIVGAIGDIAGEMAADAIKKPLKDALVGLTREQERVLKKSITNDLNKELTRTGTKLTKAEKLEAVNKIFQAAKESEVSTQLFRVHIIQKGTERTIAISTIAVGKDAGKEAEAASTSDNSNNQNSQQNESVPEH